MKLDELILVMLCINIMLVLGGVFDERQLYDSTLKSQAKQDGNFLPQLFKFTNNSIGDPQIQDFSDNLSGEITGLSSSGGVTVGSFEGFTDLVKLVRSLFGFLIDVMTAPFQLMANPNLGLPFEFRMMIGLPFSILYLFALVRWLRTGE